MKLPILLSRLTLHASATVIVTQTVSINSGFTATNSDLLRSYLVSAACGGLATAVPEF